jgi:hypothetical protein
MLHSLSSSAPNRGANNRDRTIAPARSRIFLDKRDQELGKWVDPRYDLRLYF